ncbi:MAG: HD domain-containing protein [Acholeplasmatales bacterium]|nr:HD domain-containing protein [Acholeplasmatales bacterium]
MKKRLLYFYIMLALIFVLARPFKIHATQYLSDKSETQYNVTNGLLTGKANTICQTDDGFIWIGQYAGLTRYDSRQFTTMTEYNGLNLTSIVALANKGNTLFIGGEKGFFIKDEKGIITKVETNNANLVVKDLKVWNDVVLVGTTSGLYKYTIETKAMEQINEKSISRIAIHDDNIYYYLVGKNDIYSNKINNSILSDLNVKSINVNDNKLYIGSRTGNLIIYSILADGKIDNSYYVNSQPEGLSGPINDVNIYQNKILLSCDAGLFIGNKSDVSTISLVNSYGTQYTSMEKSFYDYEGNLWLTSSALGVYKISQSDIIDYFFEFDIEEAIVYCIEKYHNYTFIGTSKGIKVVDDINQRELEVPEEGYDQTETVSNVENALYLLINTLSNFIVRDIEIFKDKIYFATNGSYGYMHVFDYNQAIDNYYDASSTLEYDFLSGGMYDTVADASKEYRSLRATDNYLFIGLDKGVARYDGTESKYIETKVYPLYMDLHDDDIYIVLNTIGVVRTNIDEFDSFVNIDPDNKYSTLKCLYANGGVLFTDNNSLYFSKDNTISKINIDIVGSIVDLFYLKGKYYVCSEANIYICDDLFKDKLEYEVFDASKGLKSSLVANSSGYYSTSENSYYIATSSGVLVYSLDEIFDTTKAQRKVALDYILVDDKKVDTEGTINIDSGKHTVAIKFSVLSYTTDQNYNVYYRLKGIDSNYLTISSDSSYEIVYKNIDGGKYKFDLYTEDFDGTISENNISFNINKDKRITEYEAFWLMIALFILLVVVAVIILIFRARIKKSIKRQNEYKKITLESIEAIARTIDAKDSYTNGHSKRVGIYSREIARALNLSDDEVQNIYYIALLHDIGKISIPLDILNKPGRLTDEEFEIMKGHTTAGGKILEGISTIPHIVEGAMYHHERFGGGGYPKGLKGEEIPFIARIICCADCYDAMATRRTYKEPYPKEKIISEFERCKGTQFDPMIADVIIKLIEEDKLRYGIQTKEKTDDTEKSED